MQQELVHYFSGLSMFLFVNCYLTLFHSTSFIYVSLCIPYLFLWKEANVLHFFSLDFILNILNNVLTCIQFFVYRYCHCTFHINVIHFHFFFHLALLQYHSCWSFFFVQQKPRRRKINFIFCKIVNCIYSNECMLFETWNGVRRTIAPQQK